MPTEMFYVCDECKKRVSSSPDLPKWWQLNRLNCSNGADGQWLFLCSIACLKTTVLRRFAADQPWHFWVQGESHSRKGSYLCEPGKYREKDDFATGWKDDVTCLLCIAARKEEATRP